MKIKSFVLRDQPVKHEEIESLRAAVGWDKMEGKYDRILPKLYSWYSVRIDNDLIGFLSVLSDGIGDAFLLDLMVHPGFQRKGIGTALVTRAILDLKTEGIKCIQVVFVPEMESFFQRFRFHLCKAGVIDTDTMEVNPS